MRKLVKMPRDKLGDMVSSGKRQSYRSEVQSLTSTKEL